MTPPPLRHHPRPPLWSGRSDFYWLITRPLLQLPLVPATGISFERYPWPWQTVGPVSGPSYCADSRLTFYKELGSSFGVTPSLIHLRSHSLMSRRVPEVNLDHRARRKPPCSSWSGIWLWTCQAWLAQALQRQRGGWAGVCRDVLTSNRVNCWNLKGTGCGFYPTAKDGLRF